MSTDSVLLRNTPPDQCLEKGQMEMHKEVQETMEGSAYFYFSAEQFWIKSNHGTKPKILL